MCCCSVTKSCPPLCNPMGYSMPRFPVLHHLPEFVQIHIYWVSDAIKTFHPLPLPFPLAFNLSQHQGFFSNELAVYIRWPKYRGFSFNISSFNEYPGKISFRIAWIDIALNQQGCHRLNSTINQHDLVIIYRISH